MPAEVRRATPQDAEALAEIIEALIANEERVALGPMSADEIRAWMDRQGEDGVMLVLQLGLYLAAAAWAWIAWASWSAGYPPEVALLRGMVAFGAVSLLAYVAELIVATAPPHTSATSAPGVEALEPGAADDLDEDGIARLRQAA